jgi:hypothetical protein
MTNTPANGTSEGMIEVPDGFGADSNPVESAVVGGDAHPEMITSVPGAVKGVEPVGLQPDPSSADESPDMITTVPGAAETGVEDQPAPQGGSRRSTPVDPGSFAAAKALLRAQQTGLLDSNAFMIYTDKEGEDKN